MTKKKEEEREVVTRLDAVLDILENIRNSPELQKTWRELQEGKYGSAEGK